MAVPILTDPTLEKLCAVMADTSTGLTGSEIGRHLSQCGITDPEPTLTKRHRLYEALKTRQAEDRCANNVIAFLQASYNPVLYTDSPDYFERKRKEINSVLGFAGLEFMDTGKVRIIQPVSNLTEATKRANRLRYLLTERGVHVDVLKFCREELLVQNYFHAVLEATKSVAEKIRDLTGLTSDAAELVDDAFSFKNKIPHLALTTLISDSEKSEQRGFANLLKGLFGTFRNPTAHAPRLTWKMSEQDALDILAVVSLAHRRLDAAIPAHRISTNNQQAQQDVAPQSTTR